MERRAPWSYLDLERYPIRDLAAPAARALVARCHAQLMTEGCCELPGFLTPEATERMVKESETLAAQSHHARGPITAYLEIPDRSLPEAHPRRSFGLSSLAAIGYDLFPAEHALRRLYAWDGLVRFLEASLGVPRLHRYADPMSALNVAVMKQGDELFWHFDQCDFVVSIALRDASEGGDFEYAPNLRSAADENYGAVKALLDGSREHVKHVPMTPGTLLLFRGRNSIHRVTPIAGPVSRLVGLLAYDERPDVMGTDLLRMARYGRTLAPR
jgi:hypothetical protein